jgi:hypothetical protein
LKTSVIDDDDNYGDRNSDGNDDNDDVIFLTAYTRGIIML